MGKLMPHLTTVLVYAAGVYLGSYLVRKFPVA